MSVGGGGYIEDPDAKARVDRLAAKAEALRAVRAAGASGRLGSFIRRWQERRRLRHTDLLERKATARENLRDFKHSRDEPGQWTGGM